MECNQVRGTMLDVATKLTPVKFESHLSRCVQCSFELEAPLGKIMDLLDEWRVPEPIVRLHQHPQSDL